MRRSRWTSGAWISSRIRFFGTEMKPWTGSEKILNRLCIEAPACQTNELRLDSASPDAPRVRRSEPPVYTALHSLNQSNLRPLRCHIDAPTAFVPKARYALEMLLR